MGKLNKEASIHSLFRGLHNLFPGSLNAEGLVILAEGHSTALSVPLTATMLGP